MKNFKLKKPTGMTVVLVLLSLLCATIYGSIAAGLASQIGKAPGVVQGVTADQ
jgi:Na+-transporting methylmalonyl-CoA/oxaloacetate decarboxylase gamma subunit